MSYSIGQTVRLKGSFKDFTLSTPTVCDPTTVSVEVVDPAGTAHVFIYPTDIVRASTGVYYYDFLTTLDGEHSWKMFSTGLRTAAAQSVFDVDSFP